MAGDSPWRRAAPVAVAGYNLPAVKPHDGGALRAVCIAELRPDGYAAVMDATEHGGRPMVDGTDSWAFARDVRRALLRQAKE